MNDAIAHLLAAGGILVCVLVLHRAWKEWCNMWADREETKLGDDIK